MNDKDGGTYTAVFFRLIIALSSASIAIYDSTR